MWMRPSALSVLTGVVLSLGSALGSGAPAATAGSFAASAQTDVSFPHDLDVQQVPVTVSTTVSGLLWRPAVAQQRNGIGVIMTHENADFSHHLACGGLASRGFEVLCVNGRYQNIQGQFIWDNIALDVKDAVSFMRQVPELSHVILLGHSGGGAIMSYYQNVAENGVSICNDGHKLDPCSDALAGLPPADGVMLMDPIPGHPFSELTYWDPSVVQEDQFGRITPSMIDPSLNMFDPANGFDAVNPHYSADFVRKFFAAQAARNERLVALAQSRAQAIKAGQGYFPDDEPFIVSHAASRLLSIDTVLVSHTRAAHDMLTPRGIVNDVVRSIRPVGTSVVGAVDKANVAYGSPASNAGAIKATVNTFLSGHAIHASGDFTLTADDILGVDWTSTNDSTPNNVAGIHAPILMVSATGHYWLVSTEIAFNMAASPDKTLAYVFGSTHGWTPCKDCGVPLDQIGDPANETWDYFAEWMLARFV
jgi:pimeloyl-ACP methyl ester carboxylesterase